MSKKSPLKYRELAKKLKQYDVIPLKKRGKGSERIFIRPIRNGELKGPQYPIKCHGEGTEISKQVIVALLRRFDIDEDEFYS